MSKLIINITYLIFAILLMSSHGLCVVWPISNSSSPNADVMTSAFGPRISNNYPYYYFHEGLDIRAQSPLPVHLAYGGWCTYIFDPDDEDDWQEEGIWGRMFHRDYDGEPEYYMTQYLHLSEVYVEAGPYNYIPEGYVIACGVRSPDLTPHLSGGGHPAAPQKRTGRCHDPTSLGIKGDHKGLASRPSRLPLDYRAGCRYTTAIIEERGCQRICRQYFLPES